MFEEDLDFFRGLEREEISWFMPIALGDRGGLESIAVVLNLGCIVVRLFLSLCEWSGVGKCSCKFSGIFSLAGVVLDRCRFWYTFTFC